MQIEVLPPNINYSFLGFSIVVNEKDKIHGEAIRFGLYTIKNLGRNIAEAIISERVKNGSYKDLEDFIHRIKHKDLNRKSLESLIMCGALDDLGERNEILFNINELLEYHKKIVKDNQAQNNLFNLFENEQTANFKLKKCDPATQAEKLKWEKELIGCYISGSPLDKWANKIINRQINIKNIIEESNSEVKDNANIKLPVLIEKIKTTKTKNGEHMALLKVSDLTGRFEVAVFPKSYTNLKSSLILNIPLLLVGKIANKNGEKTMILDKIENLN